jgi:hypothetical protein
MVPAVWSPKFAKRREEIMATWGARVDVLRFFVDPTPRPLPSNVVNLTTMRRMLPKPACPRGGPRNGPCRHIWEKVWRAWLWVSKNEIHLAEWFAKVDDDTFVYPEQLRAHVRQQGWRADERHYFGAKLFHREHPLIAGAATFFSRATVSALGGVLATISPTPLDYGTVDNLHRFHLERCEDRAGPQA